MINTAPEKERSAPALRSISERENGATFITFMERRDRRAPLFLSTIFISDPRRRFWAQVCTTATVAIHVENKEESRRPEQYSIYVTGNPPKCQMARQHYSCPRFNQYCKFSLQVSATTPKGNKGQSLLVLTDLPVRSWTGTEWITFTRLQ